ncbi:MAG: universal stress protein [Desulfopila sp.]|jgi:nucleotide-binding universal stress UspA family protein|nr:universal stress protein [Desulfopila sp.]
MEKKRILVAVDGSDFSAKVMEKAIEYARLLEAEVVFVHCHKRYPRLLGQPYRDQIISEIRDETHQRVAPYLAQLGKARIPYIERLLEGPAGETIAETAKIEKCRLIVMGSRGLSNLKGLIIGSVSNRVLHVADCPVMVVK